MRREIGGYFELEEFTGEEYYSGAIALDCARNAIAYAIKLHRYKKVYVPGLICSAVLEGIKKGGASYETYPLDRNLRPNFTRKLQHDEVLYLVNYYGQITNQEVHAYRERFQSVLVDNTQAFFQRPSAQVDTIYCCRKFFGVPDGAYLFSQERDPGGLLRDHSYNRMVHILGRYEMGATALYPSFQENEAHFIGAPIQYMSLLTHNLLRAIDYEKVSAVRKDNCTYLDENLRQFNQLQVNSFAGAFMYPLYLAGKGRHIRECLRQDKIYIPCFWPNVMEEYEAGSFEYDLSLNLLPLPCDQRYGREDMDFLIKKIHKYMG